jgi:hypothetical protein
MSWVAPSGKDANWLEIVPDRGLFVILRLYEPTEDAINKTWVRGDIDSATCVGTGMCECRSTR